MYLFRYISQGPTARAASPQCLHDQGGFRGIHEDSRGLASAWKTPFSPLLAWEKGAPSRTCVTAVLHLQILSPRPITSSWIRFGIAWSGFGLRLDVGRARPCSQFSSVRGFVRRKVATGRDLTSLSGSIFPALAASERSTRGLDPRTP